MVTSYLSGARKDMQSVAFSFHGKGLRGHNSLANDVCYTFIWDSLSGMFLLTLPPQAISPHFAVILVKISISRSTWASGGEEWDVPAVEEESTCHHRRSVCKIHVARPVIALGLEVVFRKPGMVHIVSNLTIIVE